LSAPPPLPPDRRTPPKVRTQRQPFGSAVFCTTTAELLRIGGAEPADYDRIIAVMDDWWGRPVSTSLVRLFLDHFHGTSLVADARDERAARPVAGYDGPGKHRVLFERALTGAGE
jgi:hypothetical protein